MKCNESITPRNMFSTTSGEAVHIAPSGQSAGALEWNRQLGQVAEVGKTLADQRRGERVAQMGRGDRVIGQGLAAHRFVAEDSKRDAIALGVQSPIFERQSSKHPTAAAGAGDGDGFAFQVRGSFDFWRGHDVADQFVDDAGDKHQIHSLGGGARARRRWLIRNATGFRPRRVPAMPTGPLRTIDKRQFQTVAAKEALVLSHVIDRIAFAEGAAGHDDFSEILSAVRRARCESGAGKYREKCCEFKLHRAPPRRRH